MYEIDAGKFVAAHAAMCTSTQLLVEWDRRNIKNDPKQWPLFVRRDIEGMVGHARVLAEIGRQVDLTTTVTLANQLIDVLELLPIDQEERLTVKESDFHRLTGSVRRLSEGMQTEAMNKWVLALGARGIALWKPKDPIFGQVALDAFPSAQEDIEEAAKCLAVERGTACVMHLMRATEVPLKALAGALNVGSQNDWGSYIREIDRELDARLRASGKRTPDEAFYAEIVHAFDRVKRAWRNSSMHVDKTYTPERATDIFESIKSFMAHLATRIHE